MKPNLYISCPASSRSGYGNHSRDLIRSLIQIDKFKLNIIDQRWGNCPKTEFSDGKNSDIAKYIVGPQMKEQPDIWIQVTVPNEFQPVGKYNIGITAGIETDRVSPEWIEGMNRMDVNIVPSEHSRNTFNIIYDKKDQRTDQTIEQLKIQKPLELLFEGVDTEIYNKNKKIEKSIDLKLSNIKEDFCFLLCGHWMNGEFGHDRKDIGGTIKTFLETFKNTAQRNMPALVIKTGATFSIPEKKLIMEKIESIQNSISSDIKPSIYLLWGELSDLEMNSLYNHSKIKAMISFTHGEGYGRPLAEFSMTGKPIIVSDWSGHKDFISKHGFLLPGEVKQVHKSVVWDKVILKDSGWFFVNYGYASGIIKDITKNYKKYIEKSRKQTQYMKDNFTLDKMTTEFEVILDRHLPSFNIELPKLEELQTYE